VSWESSGLDMCNLNRLEGDSLRLASSSDACVESHSLLSGHWVGSFAEASVLIQDNQVFA
jgi:hypothetical protein